MHVNMYVKNMYISQTQGYFLFFGHGTDPWTKATQCSDLGRGCVLLFAGYIEQKFRVANLGKEIVRQQTYLFLKQCISYLFDI